MQKLPEDFIASAFIAGFCSGIKIVSTPNTLGSQNKISYICNSI